MNVYDSVKTGLRRLLLWAPLGIMILGGCKANDQGRASSVPPQKLIPAQVIHARRDVQIYGNGIIQAWERVELSVPDSAELIALLAEENDEVKKGDLLASLLIFSGADEYIPVNLTSPINGTVTKIYYGLQAPIPAGMRVIEIKNFSHYIIKVKLSSFQLDYVKRNDKAELLLDTTVVKSRVHEIDRKRNEVLLLSEPESKLRLEEEIVPVKIDCPGIKGSYLPRKYFAGEDSLAILLQDSIAFNIYPVGKSDSLILIYPPLPDVQDLKIRP